VTERIAG